ncbi:MAG: 1-deoxy-D-xylulose-5-phosphate reductoisomerase [Burkholderiales bacterium]|nr:1-deoxy-D-xylulose-5-phosphate reductoisomerase [Burkholderiales bacterium]
MQTTTGTAHGAPRRVCILGATGSIGASTLDVIACHPDRFEVTALAAHRNVPRLAALCRRFRPRYAVLVDAAAARALEVELAADRLPTSILAGEAGLITVASLAEVDTVLAAIVGAAGLASTLAAARAGKRILLANKEALVLGGALFMAAVRDGGATLLPIDSEHNAIFQCLPPTYARDPTEVGVRRILLTASGGPFRTRPVGELADVTPDEACAHPNWSMGRKISVDSATMMNKGLEVIEAHWLFGVAAEAIDVVIHPQSIVHSLVEYVDGSVLAQLGHPDMRTPIAQALGYPERIATPVPALDLAQRGSLSFEACDFERFPCLTLAYAALRAGGTAPALLNAANEIAVEAFLAGKLRFTDIVTTCAHVLAHVPVAAVAALDDVHAADTTARSVAQGFVASRLVQGRVTP